MLKGAYQNVSRDLLQPAASLPSLPFSGSTSEDMDPSRKSLWERVS